MINKCINPKTVEEALDILESNGKDVKLIAGGTDLVIDLRNNKIDKNILMNISKLKELRFITIDENEITIGSGTKFIEIIENQHIKEKIVGLWKACKSVGSPQIRNMGTIGGNICNGSMAADSVPPLLALDATALIIGKNKTRSVPLRELYLDKGKVDIADDEILYAIKFHRLREKESISFEKLGLRKALAIARISCSIYINLENNSIKDIKIATGALGKYPQRENHIEKRLVNKKVDEIILKDIAEEMSKHVSKRLKGRSSRSFKSIAIKGIFAEAYKSAIKGANDESHKSHNK
ncbi:FAD binding domain-containing protein [Lutibacter sp. B2]|nr:FAD binding domain-containing protein [Lutibacter sp. B2]